MTSSTDRLGLPLLAAAQAQKETTHNEALALADIAMQAVVQSVAPASVPPAPTAGQCWIVGASASGAWSGRAGALAAWTAGGWRFVAPFEGMRAWSIADGAEARYAAGAWTIGRVGATMLSIGGQQVVGARGAHVVPPAGGTTVDTEARAAIAAILSRLEAHGLIAS